MRVLFITNDLHDALNSRIMFKNWYEKKDNYFFDIAAPVNSNKDIPGISLKLKNRGITFSNIHSINSYIDSCFCDTIVYRGIENIILSLFIKSSKDTKVVFLLTGLGKLFSEDILLKNIIRFLYRYILKFCIRKKKGRLIVQNIKDRDDLGFSGIITINGSGFSNKAISNPELEVNIPTIITATRLKKSKGLDDIIELSETIVNNKLEIKYYILGDFSHLNETYQNKISELNKYLHIHFLGFKNDISHYISKSHFAYYPTKYREGVPRFLIQSLSNGLILFTNSMPGCSLMVSNENGFLNLTTKDVLIKITNFNNQEFDICSINSRKLFETIYSDNVVFPKYFRAYE